MPVRLRTPGLPLLTKELIEQSARKRTYVIRTLYAALLFFVSLLIFYFTVYRTYTNPLDILGRGREIFTSVLVLQFAGIFLFMPAITCSVITAEKERNTFGLLLLTRLGPTTILLEKLLGRLVPMLSFLLMSLPLIGFAYSLGGVSQQQVWIAVWCLLLTTVQVGALALACSAFFRTTVQAFIATYVFGFLMYFGWVIAVETIPSLWSVHEFMTQVYIASVNAVASAVWPFAVQATPFEINPHQSTGALLAPVMMFDRWGAPTWWMIPLSAPVLASIAALLLAARLFIVRRAFVPARNMLLKLFHHLDTAFQRLNNNRVTKGIVLLKESVRLPDNDPIAWRETHKKSLGTIRYLIRFFVATEVPVLLVCCAIAVIPTANYNSGASEAVSGLLFVVWILSALLVTVKGATLISGERAHETLDVLLATPIRSVEIIRQKFRGVRRLIVVLAFPLATIVLFQMYFRMALWSTSENFNSFGSGNRDPFLYALAAVPAIAIYLPLVAWVSFAIGLRVRSQTRAIFAALAVIVVWCAVPFIVGITIHEGFGRLNYRESPLSYIFLLSPISVIAFSEFSELDMFNSTPWGATIVNWLIYGGLLLAVRQWCLLTAARRLGRAEVGEGFRSGDQRPRRGFQGLDRARRAAAG